MVRSSKFLHSLPFTNQYYLDHGCLHSYPTEPTVPSRLWGVLVFELKQFGQFIREVSS